MNSSGSSMLLASRAWFSASTTEFVSMAPDFVLGTMAKHSDFDIETDQRDAWLDQLRVLQEQLHGIAGQLYLEFSIPRMGKRIDAVLLTGPVVFVIEFKTGDEGPAARNQVWDYALDLKNFHAGTHHTLVAPVLVSSGADPVQPDPVSADDLVMKPMLTAPTNLRATLNRVLTVAQGAEIQPQEWASASYRPTPTIIEAARALYRHHHVEAIARFDAGATNLAITSDRLGEIVREARAHNRKAICFVTGVPGAGKTLVGLNVATQRHEDDQSLHAVLLSGNGPLVKVLREALSRDEFDRRRLKEKELQKQDVRRKVSSFIQNVHTFRDTYLSDSKAPSEHVAVFDEAQRAWNEAKTADFMLRKKRIANFTQSEPEFLISCMDRHPDWAVVVCLVGGGQEINTGEAGIDAWLDAARERFPNWYLHISNELTDSEYAAGRALERVRGRANCKPEPGLHLAVSMRSFRAENVSAFVKALLDRDTPEAQRSLERTARRYPICVTRDLDAAKDWIRTHARGSERYGMVCSSKALRLKPHAIDVRAKIDPVHWFLNDRDDTRSSFYLEDAATEFQVQGLELDWTCVNWDADLRFSKGNWGYYDFVGSRWKNVKKTDRRRYLLNAYRVLLTRARQGMVIFVPPGNASDNTRQPEWYDSTYDYLRTTGIPELS
jgi:hypothetical protein